MTERRIMIDGRNLSLEKGTGIATYARNLSHSLHDLGYNVEVLYGSHVAVGWSKLMKEIGFFDPKVGDMHRLLELIRRFLEAMVGSFGFRATKIPITGTVINDTFKSRLPYFDTIYNSPHLFRKATDLFGLFSHKMYHVRMVNKPHLMHWTYPLPLRIKGIPNIYTLHDLVPLRLPFTTLDNKRRYYKLVSKIAKKAAHIVTVSESARNDIINLLGIDPERITNTYQSVQIPAKYANKTPEVVQREVEGTFSLGYKDYYIFWGSIEPKKNIGRIIEGYLASGVKSPLVIVGAQAWKSEDELKLLYEDNLKSLVQSDNVTRVKKRIVQLNYVTFPLLVSLIKGAKATIFPSLYEGFGLPVLESMMLGTPVISSNTASIPEITGDDAALLVNPYDTQEISEAIRRLDHDSGLRDSLSEKGLARAQLFTVDKYNERLKSVYDRFL